MIEQHLLDLGSDLHLRHRYFVPESFQHPCKLHLGLLEWILRRYTRPGETVADPMSGIGGILYAATQQRHVIAREIEEHWLEIAYCNAAHIRYESGFFAGQMDIGQHDARKPWGYQADHIIFSPPYGNEIATTSTSRRSLPYKLIQQGGMSDRWNRLADHLTDGTTGSFSFHYGRHPDQVGHFRGKRYFQAMTEIYQQARVALHPGGFMILVLKDHIANGRRVLTADQTVELCQSLGFTLCERHQRKLSLFSLWQRRRKEQELPVVKEEDVLVFQ